MVVRTRPDTFAGLTRHQFRHGFTLSAKGELKNRGVHDSDQRAIIQYLLGHSSPESQDDYTRIHNQKVAKRALREINQKRHDDAKKTKRINKG